MTGSHAQTPTPNAPDGAVGSTVGGAVGGEVDSEIASEVEADSRARRRSRWRVGTPLVVLLSGALFAVSYVNSDGTDLRPGRYTDLSTLVQGEANSYQALRDQVADLDQQVQSLSAQVDDEKVRRRRRQAARLRGPAGLEAVGGAGVSVVLSDAPSDVLESEAKAHPDADLRDLVVHQQDIQAVVNALWSGGATAVTVQGQRIVSTTGIKCTGNSVQLQGVPYPAPYTIQAVGDPVALGAALDADASVQIFREDAAQPDIAVSYDERTEGDIRAPAYDGLIDLTSARPLR